MLNMCEIMQSENVILIDSNEDIQKHGINGKKVFSSEIIDKFNAEKVVIGTMDFNHFTNISKVVNNNHKSVKSIQKLYDFLFEIIKE
jgi:hypothetical protein